MSSPNPDWKAGQKIKKPFNSMIQIDPKEVSVIDLYKLLIGTIVPRPIAFVSTLSKAGKGNLAPYSFFNGVSSNPPTLMFSAGIDRNGNKKDTLINIEETKEFVVNSTNQWFTEAMVQCSAEYPHGVDEMEQVGLTGVASKVVSPARVAESAVQLECKLYDTMRVGDGGPGSAVIIVGEVVMAHVADSCYDNGKINFDQLKPVSRLGGNGYGLVSETFDIPRPILK